jgi:hypothetical protein
MELSEVLSGSAGLSGVQWILSGRPARQALRRSLEGMLSGAALGSCHLKRAKFKPNRSLTAFFDARLIHTGNGTTNTRDGDRHLYRPIQVTWKPRELDDLPEDGPEVHELQAEAESRGLMSPFLRLSTGAPEWGMHIQVFPLDVNFPQLVRLADPNYLRDVLEPYWPEGAYDTDQGQDAQISITPIRYRPGQRHVLRYDCANHDWGGSSRSSGAIYAKIYNNPKKAEETYQAAAWANGWFASHLEGVSSVEPLGYLPDDGIVLYPGVAGTPVSHLLKQPGRDVSRFLGLAGSALRSLHGTDDIPHEDLKERKLSDEIDTITSASKHLTALLPETRSEIMEALHFASDYHDQLPQELPTFGHSDFKSDHLLAGPDGLTIIDFDTSSLADPAFDVGKFLADLDWWHILYGRPCLQEAHTQFLESYSTGVPEARLWRARLYEALVLMRISVRRVPIFSRNWSELTKRLISHAIDVLHQRELHV